MLKVLASMGLALIGTPAFADPKVNHGDAPEHAAEARDRIVCKRFVRTGSLVDGYRTCKTKWEWERERINLNALSVSDACRVRGEPDPAKPGGGC